MEEKTSPFSVSNDSQTIESLPPPFLAFSATKLAAIFYTYHAVILDIHVDILFYFILVFIATI
ncbi:hypothetical protein Peur_055961 [Populus x canadensis]|jgi:hypothetical protein